MKTTIGRALTWILVVAFGLAPCVSAQDTAAGQAVLPPEQLEQLVAPIALYPDALLSQVLMASTYPLAIVEAERWVQANPKVSGSQLETAMQQKTWDPSVKSLVAVPQTLAMMSDKLDWTQKLGDAFLAQQKDLLDAVQRLRAKAQAAGNLESTKQQTVSTDTSPSQTTIIKIVQADPQVIYVPTYNPTVVYGAWPYPAYPPYYYYPPGYVAAASVVSFGVGVAVGAAIWGGCNWNNGSVNVNVNNYNSYNHTNISNTNWQHNSANRQGVPYGNASTAKKYGGMSDAQAAQARAEFRGRGDQPLGGGAGGSPRAGGAGQGAGTTGAGSGNRAGGGSGSRDTGGSRGGSFSDVGSSGNRGGSGSAQGSGGGAFRDMGSGGEARAYSNRGGQSLSAGGFQGGGGGGGGSRGGGGGGGGGSRGGGGRGGGGRR